MNRKLFLPSDMQSKSLIGKKAYPPLPYITIWPLYPSDSSATIEPLDLVSELHTKNLALLDHTLALTQPSTPTPSHLEFPNSPLVKDENLTPKPNTTNAIALLHPLLPESKCLSSGHIRTTQSTFEIELRAHTCCGSAMRIKHAN